MAVQLECESELLSRAACDPEAFGILYDFYFPKIYNYVRYRVLNPDLTDDLTSKTFEKAFAKIRGYSFGQGNFSGWLFAIAHNVVVDYYRVLGRQKNVSLEAANELISFAPGPEEAAISADFRAILNEALKVLGSRERNIIALKFTAGMTNRKIAELTGISESNVGVILYRTLLQLRTVLKSLGVNAHE